jgi:ABC-type multidrug transport system fused ATPase/permease subunit
VAGAPVALAVRPAPIEMDDEQKYKPIEWPLVRRLIRELAPFKRQYIWGIALGLVHVLCDLASPKFVEWIIDYALFATRQLDVPLSPKVLHVAGIIGPVVARLRDVGRDAALVHHPHDARRRERAVQPPRQALRPPARALDELLRQDEARAHHQPHDQRHQRAARGQRLGESGASSPT